MATLLPCAHSAGGFAWGSRAADHCPLLLGMAPSICPIESLRLSPDLLLKAEEFSDTYFPAHPVWAVFNYGADCPTHLVLSQPHSQHVFQRFPKVYFIAR